MPGSRRRRLVPRPRRPQSANGWHRGSAREWLVVVGAGAPTLGAVGYLLRTGEPRQTTTVMLLLIGSAAVLPTARYFGAVSAAALAAWGYARVTVSSTEWGHFDAALACAVVVAAAIRIAHRMTARRLEEARAELRHMAVVDPLTGLYNRRGFTVLAEQAMLDADRSGAVLTLLFVDVDGLTAINRELGRGTGDAALRETAALLRSAFRGADVVARVGGDEFCALLPAASPGVSYRDRLHSAVIEANAREHRSYLLGLSLGEVSYDPAHPAPVDDLLADRQAALSAARSARR